MGGVVQSDEGLLEVTQPTGRRLEVRGWRAGQGRSVSGRVAAVEVEEVVRFWVYVDGPAVMCETKDGINSQFCFVLFNSQVFDQSNRTNGVATF